MNNFITQLALITSDYSTQFLSQDPLVISVEIQASILAAIILYTYCSLLVFCQLCSESTIFKVLSSYLQRDIADRQHNILQVYYFVSMISSFLFSNKAEWYKKQETIDLFNFFLRSVFFLNAILMLTRTFIRKIILYITRQIISFTSLFCFSPLSIFPF